MSSLDPSHIMQIGFGFWPSKVLLTSIKLELYTILADESLSGATLKERMGLNQRALYDFLDSLVCLNFLSRDGLKDEALYKNTPEAALFLNKKSPQYIGGILEMANDRLYKNWGSLEESLRTGKDYNELNGILDNEFDELYSDPDRLRQFVNAMSGIQMGNFIKFSKEFDFSPYKSMCDIGGSAAILSVQVALNNEHMQCISADLPAIEPIALETITASKVKDQVSTQNIDFFKDEFPNIDVSSMGNIMHDWGLDEKKMLIEKAFRALPEGGAFVVIENIIDDERNKDPFGLLMSLNMLVETKGGFDYTFSDFTAWVKDAGFKNTSLMHLEGPSFAAIAIK